MLVKSSRDKQRCEPKEKNDDTMCSVLLLLPARCLVFLLPESTRKHTLLENKQYFSVVNKRSSYELHHDTSPRTDPVTGQKNSLVNKTKCSCNTAKGTPTHTDTFTHKYMKRSSIKWNLPDSLANMQSGFTGQSNNTTLLVHKNPNVWGSQDRAELSKCSRRSEAANILHRKNTEENPHQETRPMLGSNTPVQNGSFIRQDIVLMSREGYKDVLS